MSPAIQLKAERDVVARLRERETWYVGVLATFARRNKTKGTGQWVLKLERVRVNILLHEAVIEGLEARMQSAAAA